MPLAGLEVTTGQKTYVALGEPATLDVAGFEALTWVKIAGVVSFAEWGDSENDVSEPLLEDGRVIHLNGVKDGGEAEMSIQHLATDAGSDLLKANRADPNTMFSIKKEYKSGDAEYACAVFTAPKFRAASGGSDAVRGRTVMARINSGILEATAAEIALV